MKKGRLQFVSAGGGGEKGEILTLGRYCFVPKNLVFLMNNTSFVFLSFIIKVLLIECKFLYFFMLLVLAYTISKYGMSMCVLGMAEEFRGEVAVNALWPKTGDFFIFIFFFLSWY